MHSRNLRNRSSRAIRLVLLAVATSFSLAHAQTTPHRSVNRDRYGIGLNQQELPRGKKFEPRVELAAQYADNVSLDADGAPQLSVAGLELSPGFYTSYANDWLTAALDYALIGRVWEESDFNGVSHDLAANGQWRAYSEVLTVDASAVYKDSFVDPADGVDYGSLGIFGSPNLVEEGIVSITPTLRKKFKAFEAATSLRVSRTFYFDSDDPASGFPSVAALEESTDKDLDASIGTSSDGKKLFGRAYLQQQRTDYQQSPSYRFERAGLDGGYRVTSSLALVGDAGQESDLIESTTVGGFDSAFWNVGLRLGRDERSSAEVRVGKRFFGDTYSAHIVRQMRILSFDAGYAESLETETRLAASRVGVPGSISSEDGTFGDFGRIDPSPYLSKDARLGLGARGARTTLRLGLFDTRRQYLRDTQAREDGSGATFSATRRLASNLSMDLDASYIRYDRVAGVTTGTSSQAIRYIDRAFLVRANRTLSQELTASLEGGILDRSGSVSYRGWWLGLRGRWSPASK